MTPPGTVTIVGAGPGDPELITVRGLARLRAADVVVYDRLVDPRLVDEAPRTAERVYAGKSSGHATLEQECIERILIERALAGRRVVRLKGGDPFVFGRGGEELAALVTAGIPVEVVPGVTSALAVPGAAGIPVTHRELASCCTIVTGHEDPRKPGETVDWDWVARSSGTVVILMGLHRLGPIRDRLIAGGRAADTPSAAIASGTLPAQRVVVAPLAHLPERVAAAGLTAPALVVIGDVVRLRERLTPPAGLAGDDARSIWAPLLAQATTGGSREPEGEYDDVQVR